MYKFCTKLTVTTVTPDIRDMYARRATVHLQAIVGQRALVTSRKSVSIEPAWEPQAKAFLLSWLTKGLSISTGNSFHFPGELPLVVPMQEEASDTELPSDDDETDDFYSDYTNNYILNHGIPPYPLYPVD